MSLNKLNTPTCRKVLGQGLLSLQTLKQIILGMLLQISNKRFSNRVVNAMAHLKALYVRVISY